MRGILGVITCLERIAQVRFLLRKLIKAAEMLEEILQSFAKTIQTRTAEGFVSSEWVTDGYWIEDRWLHGAFWGALAAAAPAGTMALVEPGMGRGFRPDLAFIKPPEKGHDYGKMVAVIEYESSNSSDERLIAKDLAHYREAMMSFKGFEKYPDEPSWVIPPLWLIISTLPSCPVERWPWHGYNKQKEHGPQHKDRKERDANPLNYYEDSLHKACGETWAAVTDVLPHLEGDGVQLVWANVSQTDVRVMNINGKQQERDEGALAFPLFSH